MIIVIILIIRSLAQQPCYSTCLDQSCLVYSPNSCSACPDSLVLDPTTNASCIAIPEKTLILGSVDHNWVANSTPPNISEIIYGGINYTSAATLGWPLDGLPFY